MLISEIKDNSDVKFVALVAKVTRGTSNNRPYLSITLQDNSGTIEGKRWDASEQEINEIEVGKIVSIEGNAYTYGTMKTLQIKINAWELLEDNAEIAETLVKSAPVALTKLEDDLRHLVTSIQDEDCFKIVNTIYERHIEKIKYHPAAMSNHHEYRSGLLHHTISMARVADMLCTYYTDLNRDILISGVLLHDIGKIYELTSCIAPRYTIEGNLIGHISMIQSEIHQVAEELQINSETVMLLEHMVLAHHGKREFGSPVLPMTKEALVLSVVDDLDAKLNTIDKELEKVNEGEFTYYIRALEGRQFYKPHKKEK